MATAFGGLTEYGGKEVDLIDIIAVVAVPWFAATIFGVLSFEISIFGGYDVTAPIWSPAGVDVSIALLAVVGGVTWILVTNEFNGSDYRPEEIGLIVFAFLTPIMFVFVPAFESLVMWHDASQLFFTLAVSVAATWISYVA